VGVNCPGAKWIAANGFTSDAAAQTTAERWLNFDQGVTNAPDLFGFAIGGNGALGIEFKQPGAYRIWSAITFTVAFNALPVARDKTAVMQRDYANFYSILNESYANGINTRGLQSAGDKGVFYTQVCADVLAFIEPISGLPFVVSTLPYNVVEMGMAQDTTFGGTWEFGFMAYQLPASYDPNTGDFPDLTYLP
jgi:hypothetical protein